MTVRELIAKLSALDQDLQVVCYTEDEELLAPGHIFRLLAIVDVDVAEGEKLRDSKGHPTMKFGSSPDATRLAVLDVTAHF